MDVGRAHLAQPAFAQLAQHTAHVHVREAAHLADVALRFSNGEADVSLEEVFIRATGGTEN